MLLNSYMFIFAYLPILLFFYFLCNKIHMTAGKMILVIGSMIFYAYADWHMLFFLLGSVMCNYIFAYLIWHTEWRKAFLAIPIVMNVGLLLLFKYADFVITNLNLLLKTKYEPPKLLLPLGISFITFQQIAYLTTIYRERCLKSDGGGGNRETQFD